jgi:hypothetical protein
VFLISSKPWLSIERGAEIWVYKSLVLAAKNIVIITIIIIQDAGLINTTTLFFVFTSTIIRLF